MEEFWKSSLSRSHFLLRKEPMKVKRCFALVVFGPFLILLLFRRHFWGLFVEGGNELSEGKEGNLTKTMFFCPNFCFPLLSAPHFPPPFCFWPLLPSVFDYSTDSFKPAATDSRPDGGANTTRPRQIMKTIKGFCALLLFQCGSCGCRLPPRKCCKTSFE